MNLKNEMERRGLKKGSLVNLVLKDGVEFNVLRNDSNEFPYNTSVYSMANGEGRNSLGVKGSGYMVEIDNEKIRLVQNFSPSSNENDEKGYTGGTVYYFNTIEKAEVFPSINDYYGFIGERE